MGWSGDELFSVEGEAERVEKLHRLLSPDSFGSVKDPFFFVC